MGSLFKAQPACIMKENNLNIQDLQQRIAVYEDETAYKQLFFHLFPSLQNFAYSIIKSREQAEEIASDIFITVWMKRSSLMSIENLKLYLFISVRNASVKKLNQEKKKADGLFLDEMAVEFISDYANPEESMVFNEIEKKIKSAIRELPPRCQLIYKLAKEENMRYKDISQLLDLSIKTIDNQLAIAVKKIASVVKFEKEKK